MRVRLPPSASQPSEVRLRRAAGAMTTSAGSSPLLADAGRAGIGGRRTSNASVAQRKSTGLRTRAQRFDSSRGHGMDGPVGHQCWGAMATFLAPVSGVARARMAQLVAD